MALESRGYVGRQVNSESVRSVVQDLSYPDWLLLYYLSMSMEKTNFGALLDRMAKDEAGSGGGGYRSSDEYDDNET